MSQSSPLSRRLVTVEVLLVGGLLLVTYYVVVMLLGPNGANALDARLLPSDSTVMSLRAELDTPVKVTGAPKLKDTSDGSRDTLNGQRPAEVSGPYVGTITLLDPSTSQRLLWLFSALIAPLVAAVVMVLMWLIARSARTADPFTRANTVRIRAIGIVLIIGGTLRVDDLGLHRHGADRGIAGLTDRRPQRDPQLRAAPGGVPGPGPLGDVEPRRHAPRGRRGPGLMPVDEPHRVVCHLDALLEARDMTLTELARRVDVTIANLSILKNNRARAIRFSTLTAICDQLGCAPGDLFTLGE